MFMIGVDTVTDGAELGFINNWSTLKSLKKSVSKETGILCRYYCSYKMEHMGSL